MLRLEVSLYLESDHEQQHLKVVCSQLRLFAEGGRLLVFRYEYDAELESRWQPAAHVQFHCEHPDLARLMAESGRHMSRSSGGRALPDITDLHFPVGGSRYRLLNGARDEDDGVADHGDVQVA